MIRSRCDTHSSGGRLISHEGQRLGRRGLLESLRNALFAGVFCVLLCGPLGLFICECFDVSLPPWFTSADAAYLSGSAGGGLAFHKF